jgi:hypothetical protein
VVKYARRKPFGHQSEDRTHPVDVGNSMMEFDDQNEAAVDEVRLYRAARAMISFKNIGKRCEMHVFDVARCKAAMAKILVALGVAF